MPMGFLPAMQAELRGIQATRPLRYRAWQGVVADLWHARGASGGGGHYLSPHPRVVLFLDDGAAAVELGSGALTVSGASALYVPADVPVWSRITAARDFAHVDLHLEPEALQRRLSGQRLRHDLRQPLFRPAPAPLRQMTGLMAGEIDRPARGEMLLEGLLLATLAELFEAEASLPDNTGTDAGADTGTQGGLTPYRLDSVTRYLDTHIDRRVSVAELARAAGLSESWFAHAFKQTTGLSPQRWQMQRRIDRASAMMRAHPARPLAEIAAATGFADQAHLTRAFRAEKGVPPATWRRETGLTGAFAAEPSN